MTKARTIEYQFLREDIQDLDSRTSSVIRYSLTAFAAIIAFGLNRSDWLLVYLAPLLSLFLGYLLVLENAAAITGRAAYLRVFLEQSEDAPKYETRLRKLRESRFANRSGRLHGDTVYWIFISLGFISIVVGAIRVQSSVRMLPLGACIVWSIVSIFLFRRRIFFEAGGELDTFLYNQFLELRHKELAGSLEDA
jgi:hypothetical protein